MTTSINPETDRPITYKSVNFCLRKTDEDTFRPLDFIILPT